MKYNLVKLRGDSPNVEEDARNGRRMVDRLTKRTISTDCNQPYEAQAEQEAGSGGMTKHENELDLPHLEWLVESRSENQRVALALFRLIQTNQVKLKKDEELTNIAQALVAASFSLWRAVFLTDKTVGHENVLDHALDFLGKVILDNAIGYQQDRKALNWTFNYYVNNARYRLERIAENRPKILPGELVTGRRTPKENWTYYHRAIDRAVKNFAAILDPEKI